MWGWACVLVVLAAGCRAETPPLAGPVVATATDLGPEVARVGAQPIYAGEVAAELRRAGGDSAAALERLIGLHLLAARAQAQGVAAAPEPTVPNPPRRQAMVDRLLARDFEPTIRREALPDEDLRRAYQQVEHTYVHPRLVEVALLSVYTGPTMKPEPRARARARATAQELYQYVARSPLTSAAAFAQIAAEPRWVERKVKYWRVVQGPSRRFGPFGENMGAAVAKLGKPDQQSPLIEDESGYHIARYIGERPPRNVPFEKARDELAASYYPHWRKLRFAEWTRTLIAAHAAEIFPERLLPQPSGP